MSDAYIGEIRMFAGNFAPQNWAFCNGQIMSIAENQALYQVIGTTYGGDGQNTFALPNLQSRLPVHQGSGFQMGQLGGEEQVTLTAQQIPQHTHAVAASTTTGNQSGPSGRVWAASTLNQFASATPAPTVAMSPAAIRNNAGGQPHENMMPYLVVSFIIALFGIFPSQG
jgi:microcystin-dependent protein